MRVVSVYVSTSYMSASRVYTVSYITLFAGFGGINPFKPEFFIVIFIHYKPRIAVAILDLDEDDLMWLKNERKSPCFGQPVCANFRSKTIDCRKIKSVFRDVK